MARAKKRIKIIRKSLEAPFTRLALAVIPRLPRGAVLGLARAMGNAGYWLSTRTRRLGLTNLDLAFGDTKTVAQKKRILRESLRNFALVILDLLWFSQDSVARMDRWFEAAPSLQKLTASSVAHVGVTGHFGNWEMTGRYIARSTGSLMSVAMPLKNPAVDRLLQEAREKNGQQIIERKGALRKLVRCLKSGGTVGLLLDQNTSPQEGGVFADFFGLPAAVSSAAGLLASMTGAEIFFAYALPCADGTYRGEMPHMISPEEITAMDRDGRVMELTQHITGFYEEAIRARPECWLWSYKRWRYVPEGMSPEKFPFYVDRPPSHA
jgi:Kdo2-lipid IVA lauroyltransferase/acyltransferase